MKKKKGKRERRERGGETRAGADRGNDRGAGRPRSAVACARGRGHREAVGGWKSGTWNRERFRKIGFGV